MAWQSAASSAPNASPGMLILYTILYYIILYYTMLYYTILYYAILYYTITILVAPILPRIAGTELTEGERCHGVFGDTVDKHIVHLSVCSNTSMYISGF